ncbi:LysR family transcriptional regulator [Nocardia fluminea]|uniref:LysR family transcriptional regulator n=1 Tax=Nocardia fluminea TaxID=134984 RepID=UPI00365461A1
MDVHGRDLRYFVAVADRLSFTAAAQALYISQPALSKQIRRLESHLGAALFVRDSRSVALTPVGAALLPHALRLLATWDAAEAAVESAKAAEEAALAIGISTSPGRGILPAVRFRFTTAFPHAKPVLRLVGWDDPTAGLADGASDVAFVWLPLRDGDRYRWIVVATEPRLVALPRSHHLAARDRIEFAELLDGIVLLAAGNAALVAHDGVVTRPVTGVSPCELALAWRRDDNRPLVRGYVEACLLATAR